MPAFISRRTYARICIGRSPIFVRVLQRKGAHGAGKGVSSFLMPRQHVAGRARQNRRRLRGGRAFFNTLLDAVSRYKGLQSMGALERHEGASLSLLRRHCFALIAVAG